MPVLLDPMFQNLHSFAKRAQDLDAANLSEFNAPEGVDKDSIIRIITALLICLVFVCGYEYSSWRRLAVIPQKRVWVKKKKVESRTGTVAFVRQALANQRAKLNAWTSQLRSWVRKPRGLTELMPQNVMGTMTECRSRFSIWSEAEPVVEHKKRRPLRPLFLDVNAIATRPSTTITINRSSPDRTEFKLARSGLHKRTPSRIDTMFNRSETIYTEWDDSGPKTPRPSPALISPYSPWTPLTTPRSKVDEHSSNKSPSPFVPLPTYQRDGPLRAIPASTVLPVQKEKERYSPFVITDDFDSDTESNRSSLR